MAQNVGPILEMATEKYLLRSASEWTARLKAVTTLDSILARLAAGDIRGLGAALTENFSARCRPSSPGLSNRYTEEIIARTKAAFGDDFWGFWMLGGMSGGGMGFIFAPERQAEAQTRLLEIMLETKRELETALPFAMDPVVYDFAINEHGSVAQLLEGDAALLPLDFYRHAVPGWLRREARELSARERNDLQRFTRAARSRPEFAASLPGLLDRLLPAAGEAARGTDGLATLLEQNGFDRAQHEQIRADLRGGRIGLAMNRLPANTRIEDVAAQELFEAGRADAAVRRAGEAALRRGEVGVITYAAGVGSRWTQGAGVVKGLHPFAKFAGRHRNFIDVHLAKSRLTAATFGARVPHVFTTSHLTHRPSEAYLRAHYAADWEQSVWLSPGRSIGLRMIPTVRDLHFAWQETAQQRLDEQKEKMRESVRGALANWARTAGEGADYTDNLPGQCLHPVGHWFEVPNLLKNGTSRSSLPRSRS
jgi:hypothetical protein